MLHFVDGDALLIPGRQPHQLGDLAGEAAGVRVAELAGQEVKERGAVAHFRDQRQMRRQVTTAVEIQRTTGPSTPIKHARAGLWAVQSCIFVESVA